MQMILDPSLYSNKSSVTEWRKHLKTELFKQRKGLSDYSGKPLHQCHMHEGILSRAMAKTSWQWLIFHEYNCFLLLPEEHIPQPPSVEWCILKSFERYGKEPVVEWFYSLPYKVHPFRIENYDL